MAFAIAGSRSAPRPGVMKAPVRLRLDESQAVPHVQGHAPLEDLPPLPQHASGMSENL